MNCIYSLVFGASSRFEESVVACDEHGVHKREGWVCADRSGFWYERGVHERKGWVCVDRPGSRDEHGVHEREGWVCVDIPGSWDEHGVHEREGGFTLGPISLCGNCCRFFYTHIRIMGMIRSDVICTYTCIAICSNITGTSSSRHFSQFVNKYISTSPIVVDLKW